MKPFSLTLSTPSGNVFQGQVVMLSVRGIAGELAVMAGHIPFCTAIKAGVCKIAFPDDTDRKIVTDGGLLSVTEQGATLLSGEIFFEDDEGE